MEKFIKLIILFTFLSCKEENVEINDLDRSIENTKPLTFKDLKSIGLNNRNHLTFDTVVSNVYSEEFNINVSDSLYLYYYDGILKQVSQNRKNNNAKRTHMEFRENGNLYFIGEYIDKTPEGIFSRYNSLGILEELSVYIKGEKIFEYKGDNLNKLDIDPNWRKPLQ